jgi:hypothetical protein
MAVAPVIPLAATDLDAMTRGPPVAHFRVASVPRYFDKQANEWRDGEGLFLTVNVWRQQAENVCSPPGRASIALPRRPTLTTFARSRAAAMRPRTTSSRPASPATRAKATSC